MSWVESHTASVHAFSYTDNPFLKSEVTAATDPPASTYIMLQRAPAIANGELEQPGVPSIEIVATWGDTILYTNHLTPPRAFSIGEVSDGDAAVDFVVPGERAGSARFELITVEQGTARVHAPPGARVRVAERIPGRELVYRDAEAGAISLVGACVVEVSLGNLAFKVASVDAGAKTARAIVPTGERSVLAAFAGSFGLCAAIVLTLAYMTPDMYGIDDAELDRDRLILMQQYLAAAALPEPPPSEQSGGSPGAPGQPAPATRGAEGEMGKPNTARTGKRFAIKGDADRVELSRSQAMEEAKTFGLISVLSGSAGPTSPWGRDSALGIDSEDVMGVMFGEEIGESGGGNGLGLSGIGEGAGGDADGSIGLRGIGTCSSGVGCGGDGFGTGVGRLPGTHVTRTPQLRIGSTDILSGSLPREVVQRTVRQNFGRFRMCYENGLRANPNLQGRVTTRFVISRDGAVMSAQNGGSDLPDSGVVSCVVSAFYGLSFPAPSNGIVSVSYPIMFSPG